jgi:hypothetical protein
MDNAQKCDSYINIYNFHKLIDFINEYFGWILEPLDFTLIPILVVFLCLILALVQY